MRCTLLFRANFTCCRLLSLPIPKLSRSRSRRNRTTKKNSRCPARSHHASRYEASRTSLTTSRLDGLRTHSLLHRDATPCIVHDDLRIAQLVLNFVIHYIHFICFDGRQRALLTRKPLCQKHQLTLAEACIVTSQTHTILSYLVCVLITFEIQHLTSVFLLLFFFLVLCCFFLLFLPCRASSSRLSCMHHLSTKSELRQTGKRQR